MAEAHQAEAARAGSGLLDGRRGGLVIVEGQRGPRKVGRGGTATIFRGAQAVDVQVLGGLDEARVPVAALEEAGGIEGAAALEVSVAAVRSEGPQRHSCARGYQLIYADWVTARYMARRRQRWTGAVNGRRGRGRAGVEGGTRQAVRLREMRLGLVREVGWTSSADGGQHLTDSCAQRERLTCRWALAVAGLIGVALVIGRQLQSFPAATGGRMGAVPGAGLSWWRAGRGLVPSLQPHPSTCPRRHARHRSRGCGLASQAHERSTCSVIFRLLTSDIAARAGERTLLA
jgi:hypothetical protein